MKYYLILFCIIFSGCTELSPQNKAEISHRAGLFCGCVKSAVSAVVYRETNRSTVACENGWSVNVSDLDIVQCGGGIPVVTK